MTSEFGIEGSELHPICLDTNTFFNPIWINECVLSFDLILLYNKLPIKSRVTDFFFGGGMVSGKKFWLCPDSKVCVYCMSQNIWQNYTCCSG